MKSIQFVIISYLAMLLSTTSFAQNNNSPVDYLPRWDDNFMFDQMRKGRIVIATGQGNYEDPNASRQLSDILNARGVKHWLDLWGYDQPHDWPTWRSMLPYFLGNIKF